MAGNSLFCSLCEWPCPAAGKWMRWLDFTICIASMAFCLASLAFDGLLVYTYAVKKLWWYFGITLFLAVVPTILFNAFSLQWHKDDKRATWFIRVLNYFLCGVIHRHAVVIKAGWKALKTDSQQDLHVVNQYMMDMTVLDLYKSFLKSGPQLVLQLYIMLDTEDWSFVTYGSCIISMVMLPMCMATYDRAQRRCDPTHPKISWGGTLLQFTWRLGTVSSRIGAMVLRGIANDAWALFIFGTHFVVTTVFAMVTTKIMVKEKVAAEACWWQKMAHCIAMGAGFTFCFINVGDNVTESISTAFIILMYTYAGQENLESILAYGEEWKKNGSPSYGLIAMILVAVAFLIGVTGMWRYRCCYHPTCEVTLFPKRTPFEESAVAEAALLADSGCVSEDGKHDDIGDVPEDDKRQLLPSPSDTPTSYPTAS